MTIETEAEMQRVIGGILWASGEMFVSTGTVPSDNCESESGRPVILCKTINGDEFQITIKQIRGE